MKARYFIPTAVMLGGIGFLALKTNALDRVLDSSSGAIPACEEALLQNLKSPSSYNRIKAEFYPQPALSPQQFRQYQFTHGCTVDKLGFGLKNCIDAQAYYLQTADELETQRPDGTKMKGRERRDAIKLKWDRDYRTYKEVWGKNGTATVAIEYDADNAYGSALRSKYICEFGKRSTDDHFSAGDIYDPYTNIAAYDHL